MGEIGKAKVEEEEDNEERKVQRGEGKCTGQENFEDSEGGIEGVHRYLRICISFWVQSLERGEREVAHTFLQASNANG